MRTSRLATPRQVDELSTYRARDDAQDSSRRVFLRRACCTGLYLSLAGWLTRVDAQGAWPKDDARQIGGPSRKDVQVSNDAPAAENQHAWPKPGEARELSHTPSASAARGCSLARAAEDALRSGELPIKYTCGIPVMDNLMRQEASLLSQVMRVRPGFYFLDDSESANAYATDASLTDDTQGTVLFGIELFHQEFASSPLGSNALIGILAHEHAHILQFDREADLSGKEMELHADLMAGWYLGRKAAFGMPNTDMRVLANSLFDKGDYAFNDPGHHGTPQERVRAMLTGLDIALRGVNDSAAVFDLGLRLAG